MSSIESPVLHSPEKEQPSEEMLISLLNITKERLEQSGEKRDSEVIEKATDRFNRYTARLRELVPKLQDFFGRRVTFQDFRERVFPQWGDYEIQPSLPLTYLIGEGGGVLCSSGGLLKQRIFPDELNSPGEGGDIQEVIT